MINLNTLSYHQFILHHRLCGCISSRYAIGDCALTYYVSVKLTLQWLDGAKRTINFFIILQKTKERLPL